MAYDASTYRGERETAGLLNLRNRTYDPATGQFLSQDPLDGVNGTPTVANPFHYADNDPLNRLDPMGLRARDEDLESVPTGGWLARKAKREGKDLANNASDPYITGVCGNYSIDFVISFDVAGCGIDDGGRLGTVETFGVGAATPGLALTLGFLLSTGDNLDALSGLSLCVTLSVGEVVVVAAQVCFGMRSDPGPDYDDRSAFDRNFTGVVSVFAGAGPGLEGLPLPAGLSVTLNTSAVQEVYDYGGSWVDSLCGRIIENPVTHPPLAGAPRVCF